MNAAPPCPSPASAGLEAFITTKPSSFTAGFAYIDFLFIFFSFYPLTVFLSRSARLMCRGKIRLGSEWGGGGGENRLLFTSDETRGGARFMLGRII